MRLLIVSHAFEPVYSACSVRWSAIAKALAQGGHDVDVLTAWEPGLEREEYIGTLRVIRAGGELSTGLRARARIRWNVGSAARGQDRAKTPLAGRILAALNAQVWRRIFWPDHAALWIFPAIAAARRLRRPYDAVISVALPFTDHLAALVARRGWRGVAWIADYGDPFSFLEDTPPNNLHLYRRLNRWIDTRVMRSADAIVMPNREMRDLYVTAGLATVDKIHVVPHIAAGALATAPMPQVVSVPRRAVTFCFAGSFARGVRTPEYMFSLLPEIIGRLSHIGIQATMHIYGALNDCSGALAMIAREIAAARIVLHGTVPPHVAHQALVDSDILVNVGNSTPHRQPSKLVEYMCSGKPILNFATGARDSSLEMLEQYPSVLTLFEECREIESAAARAVQFSEKPPAVPRDLVERLRVRHSASAIAATYLDVVRSVTADEGATSPSSPRLQPE